MSTQKQRLWIISELFPPEETSTAYIMGEIAKALSQKYDVCVLCGPEIYDKRRMHSSQLNDTNAPYKVIRAEIKTFDKNSLRGKAQSFLATTLAIYKIAKKNIHNGDKVLMVTNPAPLIVLMSRLKVSRNLDLIILVHDVFPENIKAAGIKLPAFSLLRFIFDKAYSKANKLIVLGRDMSDLLKRKTKGTVDIHIIENWGDFENINGLQMPQTEKIILQYAGNIGRVQSLEKIVEALPENIEFHLYGSGAIEEKLKSYNKENVFFHGPYTRAEQSEVLSKCHISLVTLNENMFGLGTPSKTYNILAAGRPILYFGPENSEIELLIKEYNIGYCGWPEKWDLEELREKGNIARKVGELYYSKNTILNKFLAAI